MSTVFFVLLFTANLLSVKTHSIIASAQQEPTVEIEHGKIKGALLKAGHDPKKQFYGFKGIPYAKPPTGKLRFQPPKDPVPWDGVKHAIRYGSPCPQKAANNDSIIGSEDCLTINVFTTQLNPEKLMPVMVWLHGGAHLTGWCNKYGEPDYLVAEDVVVVTLNFRLNILGFFTVNDENAYGNLQFKDQIAGLKWVQKNIRKFGGDPRKVTIFGESSGGNACSVLHLSRQANGLFQQVVIESGSALSARYLQREPLKYAYRIAEYLNVSTKSTKSIVEGLQNVDVKTLVKASDDPEVTNYKSNLNAAPFYPVIEVDNPTAVFSKAPYQILKDGDYDKSVSYMYSHNSGEWTLPYQILKQSYLDADEFDADPSLFVSDSFNNPPNKKEIGEQICEFFLGNSSARNSTRFGDFLGQELVTRGIRKELDMKLRFKQGYFAIITHEGTYTSDKPGVGHAEELQYLFYVPDHEPNYSASDRLTIRRMVKLWTNFAKCGDPTPSEDDLLDGIKWPRVNKKDDIKFLKIGNKLEVKYNPYQNDYDFWNEMFEDNAVKPLITY